MSSGEQTSGKELINMARQIRHYTDFLFDMNPSGVTEQEREITDDNGPGLRTSATAVARSNTGLLTYVERRLFAYESGKSSFWYEFTLGSLYEECRRRNQLVKSSVVYIQNGRVPVAIEETVDRPFKKVFKGLGFYDNDARPEQLVRLHNRMKDSAFMSAEEAEREHEMIDLSNPCVLDELIASKGLLSRILGL